jgi:malate dehydrogenase (oxaloacetate-decarboxylating)(NADP+)
MFLLCDTKGVVYKGRSEGMNAYKEYFAQDTAKRTLTDALEGADVFLGCSAAGLLTAAMLEKMAPHPIVFALANPDPEIGYEEAKAARMDAIVATGRSDFPNQVNNVLGFPYIFRGALDVRASTINEAMKLAAARALAQLAREPVPEEVSMAYGGAHFEFGPDYIIPKPFDSRLLSTVSLAVARAACESGVAQEPISDWDAYEARLDSMTSRIESVMQRIRSGARRRHPNLLFTDGENAKVLEACRVVVREGLGRPILLGRREIVEKGATRAGIDLDTVTIIEPAADPDLGSFTDALFDIGCRRGITPKQAKRLIETPLHFGMMMLRTGRADAAIAGADDAYHDTIESVTRLIETAPNVHRAGGFHVLLIEGQVYVIGDTLLNIEPDPRQLVEISLLGADLARDLGLSPRIALLSFSNFGDSRHPKARKVREAAKILRDGYPNLVADGEMHGDVAVVPSFARENFPKSRILGDANILICPDLDSANISCKLVGSIGHRCETIGPIIEGLRYPINVVSFNSTAREIANLAAYCAYKCSVAPCAGS